MRWSLPKSVRCLGSVTAGLAWLLACSAPSSETDPLGSDTETDVVVTDTDLPRTPDPAGARVFALSSEQLFPPSFTDVRGEVAVAVDEEAGLLRAVVRLTGIEPSEAWASLRLGPLGSHESGPVADFVLQEDGALAVEAGLTPEQVHDWTVGKVHVVVGRQDGAELLRAQVVPPRVVWAVTELGSSGIGEPGLLLTRAAGRAFLVVNLDSGDGTAAVRVAYASPTEVALRVGEVGTPDPNGVQGPHVDYEAPGQGGLWLASGTWLTRELRGALVRGQVYWRIFTTSYPEATEHGELGGQIEVDGWSDTGL